MLWNCLIVNRTPFSHFLCTKLVSEDEKNRKTNKKSFRTVKLGVSVGMKLFLDSLVCILVFETFKIVI